MLECVPNVSEGRRAGVVAALAGAAGPSLLDVHVDPDHNRSVFTLAGPGPRDAERAARDLALAAAAALDLSDHRGVHPRFGAIDVVPFVDLDLDGGRDPGDAHRRDAVSGAGAAARRFASWIADELGVPVFLYDAADPGRRTLPEVRRDAFRRRRPDTGPPAPHPRLGAVAVGARAPLVAVNCELAGPDAALARRVAGAVRERDGGLPGVRALGLALGSRGRAQVSMNLVDLAATGIETACTEVRRLVEAGGGAVERVELVGLAPSAELRRCSEGFLAWSGLPRDATVEARLAAGHPGA